MIVKADKKRLAVLVSGGGSNMQAILDNTLSGNINAEIVAVISSNADAYALIRAKNYNIPAFVCCLKDYSSPFERDNYILSILDKYRADYVLLAGYLGIISQNLVKKYKNRIVNIHPALLPKFGGKNYHGLNVHKAVIEAGEKRSGATVHFVDENIDTGLIIASQGLDVLPGDTPESLQSRILNEIEHKLFVSVVKDLCDDKIWVENNRVIYKK